MVLKYQSTHALKIILMQKKEVKKPFSKKYLWQENIKMWQKGIFLYM